MNTCIKVLLYAQCLSITGTSALQGPGAQFTTKETEFPFVVSLNWKQSPAMPDEKHFCGGTLITNKDILTARECVALSNELRLSTEDFNVRIGSNDWTKCTPYDVQSYKTYEEWAEKNDELVDHDLLHDLAIVTLKNEVRGDLKIEPAKLSKLKGDKLKNKELITTGWGYSYTDGSIHPDRLQFATVKVIDKERAKENYRRMNFIPEKFDSKKEHMHKDHVCTVGPDEKHVRLNPSDYGSPLLYKNKVVGVNSHVTQYRINDLLHNGHADTSFGPYRRFIDSYTKGSGIFCIIPECKIQ